MCLPFEDGADDMLYQSSQSTGHGNVAVAIPRLPEEVQRLGMVTRKATPDFPMVVNLISHERSINRSYVSNYA